MAMLNKMRMRLRALFFKSEMEDELDEEVRFHLEREIQENIARGMTPEEARYAAIRSFGGVERVKEESRDERGIRLLEELWQDLRYGARMLLNNPGFTAVAVVTLALGIGANSAIFSVINALLLRQLPYRDPGKLVQVWETDVKRGDNAMTASYPNFADWRDRNHVFEQIAAYSGDGFILTGTSDSERIQGAIVSPSFFSMLGIKPIVGRVFSPEEDHPNKVFSAVISERLWRRRFNSDPHITGKTVGIDDESYTVIGVVPGVTDLYELPYDTELWLPISFGGAFNIRRGHYLNVMARLKPGVTPEQAQANMDYIAGALAAQYPDANKDHGIRLVPLHEQILGDYKLALVVMLGAVAVVLLIASANVANMLLARAGSRQREIAIRIALGAGRFRLIRQLLTESLLLSIIGGAIGLLLALYGVYLLVTFGPADLPRAQEIAVDGSVLGFTLAVSLLTGVIFGLAPALQASRPDLNETLKDSGRSATGSAGHRRVRSLLVVSEIALSLILLVGAGLLMRSFLKLRAVDPGFNSQNSLVGRISLSGSKYETETSVIAFYDQFLDKIKSLPGIQSAAIRTYIPIAASEGFANRSFSIEGRLTDPADRPTAFYNGVSPDLFHTMDIPIVKGRPFDNQDVKEARKVIIINETFARRNFPGEDPIGKRMTYRANPREEDWATVVGIVKDTKPRALDGDPVAEMYVPFAQQPDSSMAFIIRMTSKPEGTIAAVRQTVQSLDKDQPVYGIRTLESVMSEAVAKPSFRMFLLGIFASVALILAMVGIYGVMSYSVAQRTHEIGIRMALGAQRTDVVQLVIGYGMALTFVGVGIGLVASFALTRVLSQFLFGVEPIDPLTFTVIALLLIGVALLACWIPAQRATKVDPLLALHCE
jgi:putative ABC transport system permease protein